MVGAFMVAITSSFEKVDPTSKIAKMRGTARRLSGQELTLPSTVQAGIRMDPAAPGAGAVIETDPALAEAAHQAAQHFLGQAGDADVGRLAGHVQGLARGRHALL